MNTPFEKRICYTLCVCELTAVLSCVSIFYLTFGIYLPAYRQLNAGFSDVPVMCTSRTNDTLDDCQNTWMSCGEWCLSKSGGGCTQIRADVRHNGTSVRLEECQPDMEDVIYCDGINPKQEAAECITGGCAGLTGLYNCSAFPVSEGVTEADMGARCRDLSNVLGCNLTSVDPGVHCKTKKACNGLNGLYLCRRGHCSRVRPPFKCEKKCTGIKTENKTIIVRENDVIFTHNCKRAVDIDTGLEIWPLNLVGSTLALDMNAEEMSRESFENGNSSGAEPSPSSNYPAPDPPMLVMYCTSIVDRQMNKTTIEMRDCFNGTLMEPNTFGERTDIITLTRKHTENTRMLDPTKRWAPIEADLVIAEKAPLFINYEACVNTLILRECEQFYAQYGVNGSDLRTNARFPCFYRPNLTDDAVDANFVIIRYDIERTTLELLVASTIPVILAVVSCTMLVICSKVVHVDDESKLYIQMCNKTFKPAVEEVVEVVKKR